MRLVSRTGLVSASLGAAPIFAGGFGSGLGQAAAAIGNAGPVAQGKQIFRFDTFGDESQWTDTLRLHEVIRTVVDPTTALAVGLKVDADTWALYERDCRMVFFPARLTVLFGAGLGVVVLTAFFTILFPAG